MTFRDESDKWAIKVFLILVVIATIAYRVSMIYEDCDRSCRSRGQKLFKLKINSIASGTCICAERRR